MGRALVWEVAGALIDRQECLSYLGRRGGCKEAQLGAIRADAGVVKVSAGSCLKDKKDKKDGKDGKETGLHVRGVSARWETGRDECGLATDYGNRTRSVRTTSRWMGENVTWR